MIAASSDGVDVVVHRLTSVPDHHGDDTRPTLLICHANGFHGRCYAPVVSAISAPVRAFAPDLRGHGLTTVPPGWRVDWRGYTDDVVAVAAALPGPVIAFGHSMGGACLLMAAHRRPELFRAFVLYEPIVFRPSGSGDPTGGDAFAAITRRRRAHFDSLEDAHANFAGKRPMSSFTPDALRAYVEGGFVAVDPPGAGVRLRCDPELEAANFETGGRNGAWAVLPEVATPTVVLGGNLRSGPPAAAAPLVAERLPHANYVGLDDLDHFAPMTAPPRIAAFIDEVLAASAPPSGG